MSEIIILKYLDAHVPEKLGCSESIPLLIFTPTLFSVTTSPSLQYYKPGPRGSHAIYYDCVLICIELRPNFNNGWSFVFINIFFLFIITSIQLIVAIVSCHITTYFNVGFSKPYCRFCLNTTNAGIGFNDVRIRFIPSNWYYNNSVAITRKIFCTAHKSLNLIVKYFMNLWQQYTASYL